MRHPHRRAIVAYGLIVIVKVVVVFRTFWNTLVKVTVLNVAEPTAGP